jgi:hypothetical protein
MMCDGKPWSGQDPDPYGSALIWFPGSLVIPMLIRITVWDIMFVAAENKGFTVFLCFQATFGYCKYLWGSGKTTVAFSQLHNFVKKFLHPKSVQLSGQFFLVENFEIT